MLLSEYTATPGISNPPIRRRWFVLWSLVAVLICQATLARPVDGAGHIVEIRLYTLKAGTQERFHALFVNQALPLLVEHQIEVVAYGSSVLDDDTYFLIRSFASMEEREQSEAAFYSSRAWLDGPRDAVLDCIVNYTTVIRPVSRYAIPHLRVLSQTG